MMTAYAAAKIVNAELKARGLVKQIPPQMIYQYVSKGMIPSTDKRISMQDLEAWFEKYYAKLTKQTEAAKPEIEADNDGTVGEWA
jgi:hypothetical protein